MDKLKDVADYWRKVKSGELPAPGPNEISITVCTLDGAVSRIAALLAELEQKDAKVDELSRLLAHNIERAETGEKRIAELEAKLATPVRLLGEMIVHDWEHRVERQAAFEHRKIAWDARLAEDKKAIRAAGFTFTVEGDE